MATLKGFRMGRWLAGKLMKEPGLVSCQQPTHRYKRGGQEQIAIPNHLDRQFAVIEPSRMVRRRDLYLDRKTLGISCCCSRPVRQKTRGPGNVILTGQQTHYESAGNGPGASGKAGRSDVP